MAITVKHSKVSTIPDDTDTSLVRPSDWNDDHVLTGTIPVANGGTGAATLTGYVYGNGVSAMTASTTIPNTAVTGLGTMSTQNSNNIVVTGGSISGTTVSGYIPTTEKAAVNGVATLDGSGTVPISQLPAAVLGALSYQGTWNASINTPTLTSSVGTKGYYYVVSVAGSTNLNGISDWQVGDWAVYNGSAWQKIDNTDAVTSVNGYTGTVVLNAADVGAVPYTGATGAVDLNAKSLTNVSNLGVGTTTVPTIKIRAVGDNNSSSRIAMRGYSSDANSSAIRVTKFRGTTSAPQAPQSGDSLGKFELAGYGTTSSEGYPQASLEGLATEAWGATARGTKAVIKVTPNTTTTQVTALTINQDSTAVFASTVTANDVLLTGNTGTVTSVAATAGTGISVSGSPITTSGTLNITNTAPDQTVVLTAGTGISTSGTYPNFTITNTSPSLGGTVTSVAQSFTGGLISVAGSPITSSGTLALTVAGTSGGIPYFSSGTTWASSAALTQYGVIYGGGAGAAPIATAAGTTGQVLTANTGGAPTWSSAGTGTVTSVGLSAPSIFTVGGSPITSSGTLALTYSGTALPVANGGTGATTAAGANANLQGYTTTVTATGTTALTNTSTYYQYFTGSSTQTITLPLNTTIQNGWSFHIANNSSRDLTVNSNSGALVLTIIPQTTGHITCVDATVNTAAAWDGGFTDFGSVTGTGANVLAISPTFTGTTIISNIALNGILLNLTGVSNSILKIGDAATTGTQTIGSTSQTGTLTVGQSTVSQTTNIQANATASGSTKTINFGTGGLTGSTTTMAIGSTFGTTVTANGTWNHTGAITTTSTLTAGSGVTGGIAGGTF